MKLEVVVESIIIVKTGEAEKSDPEFKYNKVKLWEHV